MFSSKDGSKLNGRIMNMRNNKYWVNTDMMKPSTVLLNTSRGPAVDEEALVEALRDNRIAGAGLDVFCTEPLPADHPFVQQDNVVLSPHIAGHGYEGWFRRSRFAWENIRRVATGEPPLSVVLPKPKKG